MTERNTFVTVVDGDQLNQGYFNGINLKEGWTKLGKSADTSGFDVVVAHSATTFSAYMAANIYQSTDSGITWTSKNTDLDSSGLMICCRDDKTKAFAIERSSINNSETAYTSDSGATWTTKGDVIMGTAYISDVSFSTTGLIVVAGNDTAGVKHIVFSTDNGATWTDPTTAPSAPCYVVNMWSATVGYAIDSSNNIWKTTDGGDTWTDTTHNAVNVDVSSKMITLSATTALIYTDELYVYDNGAGTVTLSLTTLGDRCMGMCVTTDGTYYVAECTNGAVRSINFYRSTDSGINWSLRTSFATQPTINSINKMKLVEWGTNNVLFTYTIPFKFDVSTI